MEEARALLDGTGRRVQKIRADLTSTEPLTGQDDETTAKLGRLDILVNIARINRRADGVDYTEAGTPT